MESGVIRTFHVRRSGDFHHPQLLPYEIWCPYGPWAFRPDYLVHWSVSLIR